jgi:hypothetical protein
MNAVEVRLRGIGFARNKSILTSRLCLSSWGSKRGKHQAKTIFRQIASENLLASVPEDGAEVTCGSRSHKQVPDEVAVSDPLGEVEHDSRGVGEPSGCNPEQSFQGYVEPKLADREHCHPTHTDI